MRPGRPICLMSTFPPQPCGLATYSAELARALVARGRTVVVLAESGGAAGSHDGVVVRPTWSRLDDWVDGVVAAARAEGAAVLHLQHTPDTLGWDDRVPRLLDACRRHGLPTAVTLHTVHTAATGLVEGRPRPARYHRLLANRADVVIVHGESSQADVLRRHGVQDEKIEVIAHGTPAPRLPGRDESRASLGLPGTGPVLLYFGFVHMLKNVHTLLRAMVDVVARRPDARLVIAGSIQNRGWYNRLYVRACRALIGPLGLSTQVSWREGYVAPDHVPALYAAADLVLLPHSQGYGSASGVMHYALGAGKLVLCSASRKFAEIGEQVSRDLQVATWDARAWAASIDRLLSDEHERATLLARLREYAERTSWPAVASRHGRVYDRIQHETSTHTRNERDDLR